MVRALGARSDSLEILDFSCGRGTQSRSRTPVTRAFRNIESIFSDLTLPGTLRCEPVYPLDTRVRR